MTVPELSRRIELETIGGATRSVTVTAGPAERAALVERFGLISLEQLRAEVQLDREGDAIRADGRLIAEVVQACVATGEPVPARIDEPFALRFMPAALIDQGDEVELSDVDCDTLPHDGKTIELGEAIAETLALALDPYPRCADAEAALREAGVVDEAAAAAASSPFANLKKG
jgi:uncharacterized metal-binding protein YceD (DUF177 family)